MLSYWRDSSLRDYDGVSLPSPEHLGLALALSVPVFVVVTKIDMCPPNVLQDTMKLLVRILKSPGCRKIPVLVQSQDDVVTSATNFTSERCVCVHVRACMHACMHVVYIA